MTRWIKWQRFPGDGKTLYLPEGLRPWQPGPWVITGDVLM